VWTQARNEPELEPDVQEPAESAQTMVGQTFLDRETALSGCLLLEQTAQGRVSSGLVEVLPVLQEPVLLLVSASLQVVLVEKCESVVLGQRMRVVQLQRLQLSEEHHQRVA
jgi:hypothetical protein